MLTLMEGLPADVLGVEARGKITHRDYRDVLIPAAETKMARGPVKMIFLAGTQFDGFELEALWDDAAFGTRHWRDFKRVAVVTDSGWLRSAVAMFGPLIPSETRVFGTEDEAAAREWIAQAA